MEHNALHILYLTSSYWKLLLFLFTVKKQKKAKPSYSPLSASVSHLESLHVFLGGQTKSRITVNPREVQLLFTMKMKVIQSGCESLLSTSLRGAGHCHINQYDTNQTLETV